MIKRSACLLTLCMLAASPPAMSAPLQAGAAFRPERPAAPQNNAPVMQANFLTRLLEGNEPRRRSSSQRRSQNRVTNPEPPPIANIPVPLPRPDSPPVAAAPGEQMAASSDTAKEQSLTGAPPKAEQPAVDGRKPENGTQATGSKSAPAEPANREGKAGTAAPDAQVEKQTAQPELPPATSSEPQANPPAVADVPAPLPKPAEPATAAGPSQDGPKPDGKEKEEEKAETPPPPPPPPLVKEDPEELKACLADLASLGVKFEPTDPIDDGNGCGIENPIDVEEILPGVKLGGATMRCKTAQALGHWLKDTVQPAMTIAMPGRRIVGVVPGSTYACRLRNSAATGKISEHARGNAYDVAAFRLDNGEKLEMKPRTEDSTMEGAFQRTATAGACLHFSTVLSPGSDAAHETHLHLDVLERRAGYRYCR